MNDEVKEILDGMKKANNENCNLWLENVSVKLLYNYITNLQNELKYQKEMEDEYIEKHTKLLQDFTNLQKENERLSVELNQNMIERNNYLSRCEKATELIEKSRVKATPFFKQFDGDLIMPKREVDKLLNLLNSGDE